MDTPADQPVAGRTDHQRYVTTDLNLASFLASRGFDPIRVEPPAANSFPRFAAFVFRRTESLSESTREWTSATPPIH